MPDLPATLTALGALVTAVGVILIAYWAYRSKERATRAVEAAAEAARLTAQGNEEIQLIHGEVREIGARIDGRLSELLKSSIAQARAEGIATGEQAQRDRTAPPS